MAARVIACPGSSELPPRPPIMFTTCPVCASPIASNETDDETHEADHDVCAACRQLEGLGK